MMDISDKEVLIRENLKDSGCGSELTERVIQLIKFGNINETLQLLSDHRKTVLDNCHAEQKKIDCLDYLVYQLEKIEL
ncbi:MAG: hypothetical protein HFE63_09170 [Clostridiales bacterium]|nr:hypothetical protein [Clostridiales bacterium]